MMFGDGHESESIRSHTTLLPNLVKLKGHTRSRTLSSARTRRSHAVVAAGVPRPRPEVLLHDEG